MLIYHSTNTAGVKDKHTMYFSMQPLQSYFISKTSATAANNLIEQAKALHRFTFSRIFGGVN